MTVRGAYCLLCVVISTLLAGCDAVTSTAPIGLEPVSMEWKDIEGAWHAGDEVFHVAYIGDGKLVIASPVWEDGRFVLRGVHGRLRKDRQYTYISVFPPKEDGIELSGDAPPEGRIYAFGRIERSNEYQMTVWRPRVETFAQAVASGKLEGSVDRTDYSVSVKLTDPPGKLAEYLAASKQADVWELGDPLVVKKLHE